MDKPWLTRPNDHDFFVKDHVARFLRNHGTGTDNRGRHAIADIIQSYGRELVVADLAGGTGVNYSVFKARGLPVKYLLIDRTKQFLEHAKELYADEIETRYGFIQELDMADNSVDIAILRHIGEHILPEEFEMAIKEALRVAKSEVIVVFFNQLTNEDEHKVEVRSSNIEGHPEITHLWNEYSYKKFVSFLETLSLSDIQGAVISTPHAAATDTLFRLIK